MGVHVNIFRRAPDLISFQGGDVIFRVGEFGDCMYVITEGEVAVEVAGAPLAVLGAGEILGELALIDSGRRTATAIARSDCRLLAIDRQRFLYLVKEMPYFSLQVMHTLVERLRREREP